MVKCIYILLLLVFTISAQTLARPRDARAFISTGADVTAPAVPTSIAFDSLGTDSTEMLITGWPSESSTTNWLAFKTTSMTVAGDTSSADSLFYAADSITGSKHWAHETSIPYTVYYMIVQYDSLANERVTTDSYAVAAADDDSKLNYVLNHLLY